MNQSAAPSELRKLDDVMLAMDIVDTLRHREKLIDRELSVEARKDKLVARLKEIYAEQGIEVPERILADGVMALEEKRFQYQPPENTFSVRLARCYIGRKRWLAPVGVIVGLAAFITMAWEFGFEAPREARLEDARVEISETIPANLAAARDQALALAETENARTQIETLYQDGTLAASNGDRSGALAAQSALGRIENSLSQDLTIRIVSGAGENSGVFRTHADNPGVRNYYLVVEAVDSRGRAQPVEIVSEEDRQRAWADRWAVRVPERVFNDVAADKQDDQIIQNAVVGEKPRGALNPQYSIETPGGSILEW